MRSIVVSCTELCMLKHDHESNSRWKQLKNGNNSCLNLPQAHWNTRHNSLLFWKRRRNGFHSLLSDVGSLVDHVMMSSHKNAGNNVRPHNAFWEGQSLKLWFRVLPFDIQVPNFTAGNIRWCRLRKCSFRKVTILVVLAGVPLYAALYGSVKGLERQLAAVEKTASSLKQFCSGGASLK